MSPRVLSWVQIIKEVFCWTREPMEVRRIAERKEVILTEMLGDMQPLLVSDVPVFMDGLASNKVTSCSGTVTGPCQAHVFVSCLRY